MDKEANRPFANLVASLAKQKIGDQIQLSKNDSLVVPQRSLSIATAVLAEKNSGKTIVLITPTHTQAQSLSSDLVAFIDEDDIELLPAWETLPFERISPSIETMGHRSRVIKRLQSKNKPKLVVASIRAAIQKISTAQSFEEIQIIVGGEIDQDELANRLVKLGYQREYQVESRGHFSIRGSIVDIFPSTESHPIRIEMWGDSIERMNHFSVADQKSTSTLHSAEIYPATELLFNESVSEKAKVASEELTWAKDSFLAISESRSFEGMESFLPFLIEDHQGVFSLLKDADSVVLYEPTQIKNKIHELMDEEQALAKTLSVTWDAPLSDAPSMFVDFEKVINTQSVTLWSSISPSPDTPILSSSAFDTPRGDNAELVKRLREVSDLGYVTVLVSPSFAGVTRMADQLISAGLETKFVDEIPQEPTAGVIYSVVADLEYGFVSSSFSLAIITDHEIAGHRHVRRTNRGSKASLQTYDDLNPGDFVVHHHHGIGVFEGLETKTMVGVTREYLILSYKGKDKLFVPSDQVGSVRKYIGGDKPKLNKLGGADFEKVRSSVRKQINLIAQELVVLYRRRINAQGFAFSPDTQWQKEMEDLFPYELTLDQARAIEEVKRDMEQPYPMDRLVCGDVGFGKTEVALRAAFKATQDSKQVAVLAPTTLLALQHGQVFEERFTPFGLTVKTLSRFQTAKEQKEIVEGLKLGTVDVVVGTHRLLSNDVKFKDLGLLVVDEEQRFGVNHKESIKKMATNVDVLTLSATPIPRTLEMSLTGIRDLSMITTPPADRQPILTYVHEYDEKAVAEAIRRELLREGQVFFVHNRVQDLEHVAEKVRHLVPEAKTVTAHGQMSEALLENVVKDFYEHKYDVLIATTIIESGLDLPSVNTLIVDRADALGLAQLYQLRGRVGRRGQRAYAYLFSPKDKALSQEAYERLKTIGEFTELGSGFKIAMRDLEIRGAGSLLGDVQSGHISSVGFDLYCEMVTNAIGELNGEEPEITKDVTIDFPGNALLPQDYVSKQEHRFDIYRRLADTKTHDDVIKLQEEVRDRFGALPAAVQMLFEIALLRIDCLDAEIDSVITTKNAIRLIGVELAQSKQVRLNRIAPNAKYKTAHALGPAEIYMPFDVKNQSITEIRSLIAELLS